MNLYELTDELEAIETALAILDNPEEINAMREQQDILDKLIRTKLINIRQFVSNEENAVEMCKREVTRITEVKKAHESKVEHIKQFIIQYMEKNKIKKMDTGIGSFTLRHTAKVEIEDTAKLDPQYTRQVISFEPDKLKIKKDIAEGCYVEGAYIKEYNTLTIK